MIDKSVMNQTAQDILGEVQRWIDTIGCEMKHPDRLNTYLLGLIALRLSEMTKSSQFGSHYYNITPVTLTDTPQLLVDEQSSGLVRKVLLWVDSASGGPTPTIRVSKGASSYNSGGVRVNAGQVNELGEVPPNVKLFGAASTSIQAYVIEIA